MEKLELLLKALLKLEMEINIAGINECWRYGVVMPNMKQLRLKLQELVKMSLRRTNSTT